MNDFRVNVFVLGAAKCGTTTLHQYLNDMPEVCMSNPKEPFFFECEYEKGNDFYQKKYFHHFQNELFIGESRHRNLYLPHVAERIHNYNKDAKLLLILRNPVERAYSHWWHAHSRGYDPLSFELAIHADLNRIAAGKKLDTVEEINSYCSIEDNVTFYRTYVDSGYYMDQIERFLNHFPNKQLKVLLTEDLNANPLDTINEVRNFLGMSSLSPSEFQSKHANIYKQPEASERTHKLVRTFQLHRLFPSGLKSKIYNSYNRFFLRRKKMSNSTRELLINHYASHNERLSKFLETDLSHWNR